MGNYDSTVVEPCAFFVLRKPSPDVCSSTSEKNGMALCRLSRTTTDGWQRTADSKISLKRLPTLTAVWAIQRENTHRLNTITVCPYKYTVLCIENCSISICVLHFMVPNFQGANFCSFQLQSLLVKFFSVVANGYRQPAKIEMFERMLLCKNCAPQKLGAMLKTWSHSVHWGTYLAMWCSLEFAHGHMLGRQLVSEPVALRDWSCHRTGPHPLYCHWWGVCL